MYVSYWIARMATSQISGVRCCDGGHLWWEDIRYQKPSIRYTYKKLDITDTRYQLKYIVYPRWWYWTPQISDITTINQIYLKYQISFESEDVILDISVLEPLSWSVALSQVSKTRYRMLDIGFKISDIRGGDVGHLCGRALEVEPRLTLHHGHAGGPRLLAAAPGQVVRWGIRWWGGSGDEAHLSWYLAPLLSALRWITALATSVGLIELVMARHSTLQVWWFGILKS